MIICRIFFISLTIVISMLSISLLPAVTLYGDAESSVNFIIPDSRGEDRYESLINPGNFMGLNDVMYSLDSTFKVEDSREGGRFTFWVSLEDVSDAAGAGDSLFALDIMRLSYDWDISDSLRLSLGRQGFLTGYGYGWNPMDLVNPLKDPSDPDRELKGVDSLSLLFDRGGAAQIELFTVASGEGLTRVEYNDLTGGVSLTLLMPFAELKLSGVKGEEYGVSGGFLADIMGAGVYGEAALRETSRVAVPGAAPDFLLEEGKDSVFSGLVGMEYVFPSELSLTAEYFYNGEGYDQKERENYKEALTYFNDSYGAADDDWYALYRPGYFGEHYMLLNLFYPIYNLWSEAYLTCIVSPDSGTLAIQPEWIILPTGSLEISLSWSGIYSFDDDQYGEAWLSPFQNTAILKAVYHF